MKKTVSMFLAVLLTLSVLLTAMGFMGITAEAASHSAEAKRELWMVMGQSKALVRNTRLEFDTAPYVSEDVEYVPLAMLASYVDATVTMGSDSVQISLKDGSQVVLNDLSASFTKDGTAGELPHPITISGGSCYLSKDNAEIIFGLKSFSNTAAEILIMSESKPSYNTGYNSLAIQIKTLGALLFDRPTGNQVIADVQRGVGLTTHPRLLIDQDKFDFMRSVYEGELPEEYPATYRTWVLNYAAKGETVFKSAFDTESDGSVVWVNMAAKEAIRQPYYIYDQQGNRLVGVRTYTYKDENGNKVTVTPGGSELGDGYDYGGRSQVDNHTKKLKYLAFAWQMTGDDKYADAFYLLAMELGKWEHWGEGHFLDCADGAVEFAIGFDWIYHAFDDEPEKRKEIADVLYRLGLMVGYYSVLGESSKIHYSQKAGGCWDIKHWDNNWQTVCGSGMVISALALAEYEDYRETCSVVINSCISTLENCLMQYAPDGGYIESPGYWTYGTNTLVIMLAGIISSCGTDYGYLDIVGLHDSFYFASYITNGDLYSWSFHDGGKQLIDRQTYYFAAKAYSDPDLAAFRDMMLFERNISADILDLLFYEPGLSAGAEEGSFGLDFSSQSIHTATMRSSWESGATFTGLHVGPNKVNHGDIDCGNIYLEMGGVTWIGDPGSEDYNVGGYWDMSQNGTRNRYYRKSLEAHTVIMVESSQSTMTRGQLYTDFTGSYATINEFVSCDEGAYAISDMRVMYGQYCTSAKRGLLLTNSRETVVLQDDISFSYPTDLIWTCPLENVVSISEDGRTVIAQRYVGGDPVILRATLLTSDKSLKFRRTQDNETLLKDTITLENSGNFRASNPERRIVIETDNRTEFHVAVVFELIRNEAEVVGYSYTDMSEWAPVSNEWVKDANKDIVYPEEVVKPKYGLSNFVSAIAKLEKATTLQERADIIDRTMICLTDYDESNAKVQQKVDEFLAYVDAYNKDVASLSASFEALFLGWMPSAKPFG